MQVQLLRLFLLGGRGNGQERVNPYTFLQKRVSGKVGFACGGFARQRHFLDSWSNVKATFYLNIDKNKV